MCGISGIHLKQSSTFGLVEKIVSMNNAIKHRGPDGEGFMLSDGNKTIPFYDSKPFNSRTHINYLPQLQLDKNSLNASIAFGHRRLSIIDLSETGHQPMCSRNEKTWITYNGEIYNYIELRAELKKKGYTFVSESDTEVILLAYQEWGTNCVQKFNGMWAFCIYDVEKQIFFASRDRFGVKPFYYINTPYIFSFASEQKAFIKSGLLKASVNPSNLSSYLVNGFLERETDNFFEGITELWPGNNLIYHIKESSIKISPYFDLRECACMQNDALSEKHLIERINETLVNSIKLRMRSDVEIGACLSGGIDSSALAILISELQPQPLYCFTSIFKDSPINEENYADLVATKINAKHFKVEPSLNGFLNDLDDLIYSQDVPIWDSSTYAQYKVMELAKQNNIKVVLDGQGADELFGGYHHHFIAKWNQLLKQGKYMEAWQEISASRKTISSPYVFFLKEKIKQHYAVNESNISMFLKTDFLNFSKNKLAVRYFDNVNDQLQYDILDLRLKIFLKCEDRCGMWHGVESRTPFSDDIELIKLVFSFDGNKKIKNGV